MFEGRTFATCSHPKVKLRYPVIFCGVERAFDSGCGKEGRFFDDGAKGGAMPNVVERGEIDLEGAVITWVERVAMGR